VRGGTVLPLSILNDRIDNATAATATAAKTPTTLNAVAASKPVHPALATTAAPSLTSPSTATADLAKTVAATAANTAVRSNETIAEDDKTTTKAGIVTSTVLPKTAVGLQTGLPQQDLATTLPASGIGLSVELPQDELATTLPAPGTGLPAQLPKEELASAQPSPRGGLPKEALPALPLDEPEPELPRELAGQEEGELPNEDLTRKGAESPTFAPSPSALSAESAGKSVRIPLSPPPSIH
jgi:hypothetical protein